MCAKKVVLAITASTTLAAMTVLPSSAYAASVDPRSHVPHPKSSVSVPGVRHSTSSSSGKRDVVETCEFEADTPFMLTPTNRNVYGQGKIDSCTTPPPDECHLDVALERLESTESGDMYWYTIVDKDNGWGSCASQIGKVVTAQLKNCTLYDPPPIQYQTVVTLTAINTQGSSDTEFAASPVADLWCY